MIRTISGVVISETPWKENSKILNILTEEGIIGVVSKGCKNIKSELRIVSQKLQYGEFIINEGNTKLANLREGSIINPLSNIKTDLTLISYFTYITELVTQIMKQNLDSNIYNLYIKTILKIENGFDPLVMMNILEIKLLDFLGVGINLNGCCKCGSTKNIVTVDPDAGGYICKDCYTNEIIYDEMIRKMLRMYYLVDIDSVSDIKIKDYVKEGINQFLSIYYDRYTGLYIYSKKFLANINDFK